MAVSDNLYKGFLKWKLKCKSILECEIAMLVETRKCKRRFGDRPVCIMVLAPRIICLDVISTKYEELCKPQTNEFRTRFVLLTSFRQGDWSVDERYNAVQAQINLANYPQETARILHRDIFWFFLRDEEFV